MWFVYILECLDGSLYTGSTNDIAKRFKEHKSGRGAKYTKSHKPVRIAYQEAFKTRSEALRREAKIKTLTRQKKKMLIGSAP